MKKPCDWCPEKWTRWWNGYTEAGKTAQWVHLIGCVDCGEIYEEYLCGYHKDIAELRLYQCEECDSYNIEKLLGELNA